MPLYHFTDYTLRDSEIALMDAIKTVFEVLVAKRILPPEVLGEILSRQRDRYAADGMHQAVFVMEELHGFVTNPERLQARRFHDEPPAGTA
jgi:hypothetical protein